MAFMASASGRTLTNGQRAALDPLVRDLQSMFGPRLYSLVAYGLDGGETSETPLRTLGLVDKVTFDDLTRAVPLASAWQRHGLAVPLLLSRHEFARTLDVFPLEYGHIIASHIVVVGDTPFAETRVAEADQRRGCEQQAKSHLIHLREGFLETEGDSRHVATLIASSAPAFLALLRNLALLEGGGPADPAPDALAATVERTIGVPAGLVVEVLSTRGGMSTVADPRALLARYIDASERIWRYVDGWRE